MLLCGYRCTCNSTLLIQSRSIEYAFTLLQLNEQSQVSRDLYSCFCSNCMNNHNSLVGKCRHVISHTLYQHENGLTHTEYLALTLRRFSSKDGSFSHIVHTNSMLGHLTRHSPWSSKVLKWLTLSIWVIPLASVALCTCLKGSTTSLDEVQASLHLAGSSPQCRLPRKSICRRVHPLLAHPSCAWAWQDLPFWWPPLAVTSALKWSASSWDPVLQAGHI